MLLHSFPTTLWLWVNDLPPNEVKLQNCAPCLLVLGDFLLPPRKLFKVYVKVTGLRWIGMNYNLRTTRDLPMSLCYHSLVEKLLWVPVSQELEAGEIITAWSQVPWTPPSSACQQSPWQHIFSLAFGNCFQSRNNLGYFSNADD